MGTTNKAVPVLPERQMGDIIVHDIKEASVIQHKALSEQIADAMFCELRSKAIKGGSFGSSFLGFAVLAIIAYRRLRKGRS